MKTAIVILNYNGKELLERFLPTVVKYSSLPDTEIYVADNCSTDKSLEVVKNVPNVKTIQLDKNYGFAEGYNRALNQIEAEYYVLLNSDVEVTEGWLDCIKLLDIHKDIVACQPKVLSYNQKEKFEYAGACGGFIDKYGYPFCRGRIMQTVETDSKQYDTITDILWATGACLIIRAKEFNAIGGFDSRFFAHMEEIDLCWRLHLQNKRIVCYPQSIVYHIGAHTLKRENPYKTYLNFRNNLLMLYKNLPQEKLCHVMSMRFVLDYVAFVQNLFSGRITNALSIVRARIAFLWYLRAFRSSRRVIQRNALNRYPQEIYKRSILVEYFLHKHKRYSELK